MPINTAYLCRYFIQLHDAFKTHADNIQKEIDKLVAELKTALGPFLTKFFDAWDKATTTEERIAAAEAAHAKLTRLLQSGAPIDPSVGDAQELLAHLIKLLRVLAELRKLEAAMGAHVQDWCS
jgi:DNA-binding ferritin-like protein